LPQSNPSADFLHPLTKP